MSTTTTNYGFVKPALTDAPPDITVMNPNWDKIDTELKKKYDSDNKPSASDVGALSTDGGTLTGNLSIKKSASPQVILNNTGTGRYATIIADSNGGITMDTHGSTTNGVQLKLKPETETLSELLYLYRMGSNAGSYKIYGEHNKPTASDVGAAASGHKHVAGDITSGTLPIANGGTGATTAEGARTALQITPANIGAAHVDALNNYFHLDGDRPINGQSVWVYNKFARILAGAGTVELNAYSTAGDTNNSTGLFVSDKQTLDKLVRLINKDNGTSTYYRLFGEHNKEVLASTLETLIANGGMSTLQSAIQMTSATGANINFSGTGKGKLFISIAGNSSVTLSDTVTIDGTKIGNFSIANGAVEIEFLESFTVKPPSGNATYLYCTAVFY